MRFENIPKKLQKELNAIQEMNDPEKLKELEKECSLKKNCAYERRIYLLREVEKFNNSVPK